MQNGDIIIVSNRSEYLRKERDQDRQTINHNDKEKMYSLRVEEDKKTVKSIFPMFKHRRSNRKRLNRCFTSANWVYLYHYQGVEKHRLP